MASTSYSQRLNQVFNYLVVALCFLLPLSRAGVSIVTSLAMLVWFFQGDYRERLNVVRRSPVSLAVIGFILLNAVSLLWSQHTLEGLEYLSKYRYLLLVPMVETSLRERFLRPALSAFLWGVGISVIWSFGIFLGLVSYGKGWPEHSAPSMNHLDYSMFLAFAALLVLNRIVRAKAPASRRLALIALLLFVAAGLFFNIGRSGQLAFFATLLLVVPFYLPGRPIRRFVISAGVVALVLVTAYSVVPIFRARTDSAIREVRDGVVEHRYDTNQGKRIAGMMVASDIIRRHPVLGTGVGDNIPEVHLLLETRYRHLQEALHEYRHLHNQYLQVGTELGLVGLVGLLLIFVQLLRHPPGDPELRTLVPILSFVFLFGFLGDPFFCKQLPVVLFSVMAGLLISEGARDPSGAAEGGVEMPGEPDHG